MTTDPSTATPPVATPVDLRCAPWTAALDVDPIGSAVPVDRLVLVEHPLPWPKDVADLPWLAVATDIGTRVQAIVPENPRDDGSVLVTRWQRLDADTDGATDDYVGVDVLVAATEVTEAVAVLAAGHLPAHSSAPAPREILVCAHGSRDVCCGGSGTRLAVEVRAALSTWRVRRTSHLGGHRFAPTAAVLPDGRVWSHLDADTLVGIAERTLDPDRARAHYRGTMALPAPAQVLEAERLVVEGWIAHDAVGLQADVVDLDEDRWDIMLSRRGPDGVRTTEPGRVEVAQRYPVLVCGEPVEAATKSSIEYRLVDQVD